MHKNAIKKTGGSFFDTKVGIFYKNVANLRNILEWRFVAIFDSRGGDFVLKLSGHTVNILTLGQKPVKNENILYWYCFHK